MNQGTRTNRFKPLQQLVVLLGFSVSLASCAVTELGVIPYNDINAQCAIEQIPSAVIVTSGGLLSAERLGIFTLNSEKTRVAKEMPGKSLNANEYWLVRISMGAKPTTGYAFTLESKVMLLNEGVGSVKLRWNNPEAGKMFAQVITHPCIYLQIEKGDYKQIRIVDEMGNEQFVIDVPEKF